MPETSVDEYRKSNSRECNVNSPTWPAWNRQPDPEAQSGAVKFLAQFDFRGGTKCLNPPHSRRFFSGRFDPSNIASLHVADDGGMPNCIASGMATICPHPSESHSRRGPPGDA